MSDVTTIDALAEKLEYAKATKLVIKVDVEGSCR